jgi:hypothetical protein
MDEPEESESAEQELPERDWLLSMLIATANKVPLSFGITLNVPGGLVSGIVVSGNEFFHGVAAEMAQVGEAGEELAKVMREIAVSRYPMTQLPAPEDRHGDDLEPELDTDPGYAGVGFIHLKDARIYSGNQQIPGDRGVWWRGKLGQVAGFCFGTLSTEEA